MKIGRSPHDDPILADGSAQLKVDDSECYGWTRRPDLSSHVMTSKMWKPPSGGLVDLTGKGGRGAERQIMFLLSR